MLRYPVNLDAARKGGFVVSFPDVPEAITQGENKADALRHAKDALQTALEFYTEAGRKIPAPSTPKPGQPVIELQWPTDEFIRSLRGCTKGLGDERERSHRDDEER
jgi:antitoxin HicB